MKTFFSNKIAWLLSLTTFICFLSCQKEISTDLGGNNNNTPDLQTTVKASVSGFVIDESNAPVLNATVTAGTAFTSTDKYGYFEIKNVMVVKNAAVVTVNKPGYFKGIKTFLAETNKSKFLRIKLLPKTIAGSIDATAGGNVTLSNGLVISLPANAVVNAGNSSAYTGSIKVATKYIDPTSSEIDMIMPGDLRGISSAGALKTLTSFGMAAVELTSASGELLQIATGKKATMTMPIPVSIVANAAATIPLWSFDEAKGLWKEEGQATKTGNNYVGEVTHFSFWNCDVPANFVQFNCTVLNEVGVPFPYANVKISVVGNPSNARYGYTDSAGYVSGLVPDNTQLLLEVITNYGCGTPVYAQTFTTTTANVSLGSITVSTLTNAAVVTGTVTDCSNNPVTNGYIIMQQSYYSYRYSLSSTGSYSIPVLLCNGSAVATFIGEDVNSLQQSTIVTQTLIPGANSVPNLQACGTSIAQFVTYTVDGGTPVNYTYPADSLVLSGQGANQYYTIYANKNASSAEFANFSFITGGIAVGTAQPLQSFIASSFGTNTQTTIPTPINVNITEYGAVGAFIAGNFSGVIAGTIPPIVNYNIVCSFRIRRTF